jgi:hypothetical protein
MTEKYTERLRHKADRLAQLTAELDALHSQACAVLAGEHADPREDTLLGQLGEARRALADYLPAVQAEAGAAAGHTSAAADYLNRVYRGPAQTGRQGGQS